MASYLQELERDGLPAINRSGYQSTSSKRVVFSDDERYVPRSRSPRSRSPRSRSPTTGLYGHRSESPLYQPRPPSPGNSARRQLELQEQVRAFKDELQKKDSMIQQLVSMESVPPKRSQVDLVRVDNLYMGERQNLEAARSELAALQVKTEKQQVKIREFENEVEIRDVKIKEMKLMNETSYENEARLQGLVDSLRHQITDLEGRAGAFESVAGRSEFTVAALQKENKASQERIVELESRQRQTLVEREEAQARVESLDRKMRENFAQFGSILRIESLTGGVPSIEEVTARLAEIMEETALLKGKLLTLSETLNNSELETKASRETIMRLVSEMGKEQQMKTRYTSEFDALVSRSRDHHRYDSSDSDTSRPLRSCLKKSPSRHRDRSHSRERDIERSARHEMEREVSLLKERLDSCQRTIDAQRSEIEIRDSRLGKLDMEMRTFSSSIHSSKTQFSVFMENIASLLGEIDGGVIMSEESIRRRIESLVYSSRDLRIKNETLEDRVRQLTEQLETQYELHKTAASRARKAEIESSDMHQRLQSAEGELAAGDLLRDGFRSDKEIYMRCLQKLGEVMKMDRISIDLGMDMTMDALMARAQQLVKMEHDALADRTTHIYNLQRKVKSVKEQLESKELHIDLLRKKITSLEEKLLGKTSIERERETETMKVRKTVKLAEKLRMQLSDARQEITNLKAQLLGSSELRVRTLEQRKELEELNSQVEELERLRKKQAKKIHLMKEEYGTSQQASQEDRVVADNAVHALSSELRTTKSAFSTIQNREKQLVDFRNVVARMLGLDINTLAIPDYEIITRLEKLINAHHSHTFTTLSLEDALADMEDGFCSGYQEYISTVGASESQNIRKSRERVKRKALKARARSMSPTRRIDPKVY